MAQPSLHSVHTITFEKAAWLITTKSSQQRTDAETPISQPDRDALWLANPYQGIVPTVRFRPTDESLELVPVDSEVAGRRNALAARHPPSALQRFDQAVADDARAQAALEDAEILWTTALTTWFGFETKPGSTQTWNGEAEGSTLTETNLGHDAASAGSLGLRTQLRDITTLPGVSIERSTDYMVWLAPASHRPTHASYRLVVAVSKADGREETVQFARQYAFRWLQWNGTYLTPDAKSLCH